MHLCVYISMFLHLLLVLHVRVLVLLDVYVLLFDLYLNLIKDGDYRRNKKLSAGDEEKRENSRSVAIFCTYTWSKT